MTTTPIANAIRNRTTLIGVAPQAPAPLGRIAPFTGVGLERRDRLAQLAWSCAAVAFPGDPLAVLNLHHWVDDAALALTEGR